MNGPGEAAIAAPNDGDAAPAAPPSRGVELAWLVGVSTFSFAMALVLYRVWDANLHLPLGHTFDMRFVTALVKGIHENGWWQSNPRLGAPFGQDLRDFPASGQLSQLLVLRAITTFVSSPGLAINIYFLGGFAVVAAVAFVVFRRLGLSAPIAAGLAVAYDFLPFHFAHGPDHLMHTTYFTAPLAVLLLVRVLQPDSNLVRDPTQPVRRPFFTANGSVAVRPFIALLVLAIVIGCSEEMIATFTVVLLVLGGIVIALASRRPARLVFALVFASAIVAVFLLVSLPTILHVLSAGKDRVAAKRLPFESDFYGLRPAFMLLPTSGHWISALGSYARRLSLHNPAPSESGQSIGTIGAIGVFASIGIIFVRALRSEPRAGAAPRRSLPTVVMPLAVVVLLSILLGVGGATFLDVLSGFTQIRTWNWIVLLIAFAAFTLTGFACEALLRSVRSRATGRRAGMVATAIAVVVLAGVGILDGGRPPLPDNAVLTSEWTSDRAFVAAMHTMQPADGMIFQFPVVPFPEHPPVANMKDYDQLRGYLADNGGFRWSYGAVKGRPHADWQGKVPAQPSEADLRALLGLGFTGLWVNRDGYSDNGRAFEAHLKGQLGPPTLVSPNGRLAFYDLRPFASRIEPGADLAAEARNRFGVTPPENN